MSAIANKTNTARVSFTQSKALNNKRSGNKKSILKRPIPAELPLSPTWHSASESTFPFRGINALLSPSNVANPKSPHVHFPPTPSMISVYSPGTYDRGSAPVTPSDSERNIKRRTIPANIPSDVAQDENAKPTRASKVFQSRPAGAIRFEPLALNSPVAVQSASPLSASVNTNEYPVSPYPYAAFPPSPLSASFFPVADKAAMPFSPREFVAARNKENGGRCHPIPSRVARKRGRRPAALNVPAVVMNPFRVFTPVVNIDVTLSPVIESAPDSGVVSDNETSDNTLSSAFWKSVSLIDLNEEENNKVEGCAYPLSALAMQNALEADLVSASNTTSSMMMKRNLDLDLDLDLSDDNMESPAPVLFGRADGTLWSPGLPARSAVSAASTEMTMYTASAGYSASAAMFSPLPTPSNNVVHSFSAHRASFGQRMGAVSRMGFNLTDTINNASDEGINSPAPFRGNPMTSPSSAEFVSITSPGLQSPSVRFGSMALHHGLGFTSPSPMGDVFPSFAIAAEKIDRAASDFEIPSLGFPAKALIGDEVEGRSRVINAV